MVAHVRKHLFLLILCGCGDSQPKTKSVYQPLEIYSSISLDVDKVTIDGQKFIVFRTGHGIAVVEADPQPEKP